MNNFHLTLLYTLITLLFSNSGKWTGEGRNKEEGLDATQEDSLSVCKSVLQQQNYRNSWIRIYADWSNNRLG
jgi:hypothetical protein